MTLNIAELRTTIEEQVESGYTAGALALAIVYLADQIEAALSSDDIGDAIKNVAVEVGSVAEVIGRR